MSQEIQSHVSVAIAGSGFAGLGMAIRLKQEGRNDFLIFERAQDIGGTWRDNTYPGCACDVESHLYSFSFAPNPDWSRMYSGQPEIQAYLKRVAAQYALLPHVRLGHQVTSATWDETARLWRIETTQGAYTADFFVAGFGALSEPSIAKLPGLDTFEGPVFHSAQWDHTFKLEGARVAVVGTGASAIQFVPAIQPKVAQLHLFQRTPPWILPRRDRPITAFEQMAFRAIPALQELARALIFVERELYVFGFRDPRVMQVVELIAKAHLAANVPDPVLRRKLTPDYTMGCKRILLSNEYLPALTRPNVEVVTDGIKEIRPTGVLTEDGRLREVDAIIMGTGFAATDPPSAKFIRGREGKTLGEAWGGSPKAHVGTTVAGFPNFFMLFGPNTGLGHTSVVLMLESQLEHVINALRYMDAHGAKWLEPTPEAQQAFVSEVDRKMQGTVWVAGQCASWYLDSTGRNSTLWPGFVSAFSRRVEPFNPADYRLSAPAEGRAEAAAGTAR